MNQILLNEAIDFNDFPKRTKSNKVKYIFFVSTFFVIFFIIFYIFLKYNSLKNEKIAKSLQSKFEIKNLYSATSSNNNSSYTAQKLNTNNVSDYYEPFVIGLIKIEKIDLVYPILSSINEDLLKVSPCRFYGPMPNSVGNMCIAGHNFANQTHFAKLHLLKEEDTIQIYDLNGNVTNYSIYQKSEISADDTSCLSQETDSQREITLITCNTIKGNRVVIKAKETTI